MTLEVSYRAGANAGPVGAIIEDADQLDHLLVAIAADDASDALVIHRDRPRIGPRGIPDHQLLIGVRGDIGAIHFADSTGSWVTRGKSPENEPVYAEMEFPPHCEVPVRCLKDALAEFLRGRERPTCVEWQDFD
ncbi:Imm1 family immunity protein [Allokutzneria sp. NRRL B-24872]|uniref:Imm1 family immunity protein n=1 Tax=Allokutzneria sp. NRRL B-24872 TaxID=1137961 RepID=UPI00143D32C3|nr:Imm1 family immunity protein [Allokutzneria sp. NRRL B-24872]